MPLALAHPEFGSSVNPITTRARGTDYAHHITASPPGFKNPAAALVCKYIFSFGGYPQFCKVCKISSSDLPLATLRYLIASQKGQDVAIEIVDRKKKYQSRGLVHMMALRIPML